MCLPPFAFSQYGVKGGTGCKRYLRIRSRPLSVPKASRSARARDKSLNQSWPDEPARAPAADRLIRRTGELVDEEGLALLRQVGTAIEPRRHQALVRPLEPVVGAVLAFAQQYPVR